MIAVLKPIIFAFLQSESVKKLVVELLEAYAKTTDNTIDDSAVKMVKDALLPEAWHRQGCPNIIEQRTGP